LVEAEAYKVLEGDENASGLLRNFCSERIHKSILEAFELVFLQLDIKEVQEVALRLNKRVPDLRIPFQNGAHHGVGWALLVAGCVHQVYEDLLDLEHLAMIEHSSTLGQ